MPVLAEVLVVVDPEGVCEVMPLPVDFPENVPRKLNLRDCTHAGTELWRKCEYLGTAGTVLEALAMAEDWGAVVGPQTNEVARSLPGSALLYHESRRTAGP